MNGGHGPTSVHGESLNDVSNWACLSFTDPPPILGAPAAEKIRARRSSSFWGGSLLDTGFTLKQWFIFTINNRVVCISTKIP